MLKKMFAMIMVLSMLSLTSVNIVFAADANETKIVLSDTGIKVNGDTAATSASAAVYTGAAIVYYEDGKDSTYGEGTAADVHTAAEAAEHTVVTITQAGTYRISGKLSSGQIAIDLGKDASTNANAVVTLILDGADITCTVAPAIIFYNVYECGVVDLTTAKSTVDTSKAGANVIIEDGSVNKVNGSYVARIYKEGTVKKLHKYDGAFYSKMSMNISGGAAGTGKLYITASNEGLDSELHLTINSGNIWINAYNDGINTNEDGVSVITINGGYLNVVGGLGVEGDGLDSNGFLAINNGTVIAYANPKTGDGGIDADKEILINGGTVIALGNRNDATSTSSAQVYMELSYASTKTLGTVIRIEDQSGKEILTFVPTSNYQSLTFSSSNLKTDIAYTVYSGGIVSGSSAVDGLYTTGSTVTGSLVQQFTGNSFGMGGMTGGQRPDGTAGQTPPDGTVGQTPPSGFDPQSQGNMNNANTSSTVGSVGFTITKTTHSFSGVSDYTETSGKTAVTFSVNSNAGMSSVASGGIVSLANITATKKADGTAVSLTNAKVQLTITDVPSENYSKSCLLSDGTQALAAILPTDDGTYQLTISVLSEDGNYTGTSQWMFTIGALQTTATTTESAISVSVNGKTIPITDVAPTLIESRVFVPLRVIIEDLGYDVEWNEVSKTVTVTGKFSHIVGTNYVTFLDGTVKTIDVESFIKDSRTMVPIRLFAEALGAEVSWDQTSKTAEIILK